jgi:superfamily II DNA or RNA helicase
MEQGVVWVIAHRHELLRQLSETLTRFDIEHGVVKAGMPFEPHKRVQVASIQTLAKRHHLLPPPDLIVYDEVHHLPSKVAKQTVETYPLANLLGVTATPCRLDGRGLGEVFDHMILGPTTRWLTDNGFLCPAEYYGPPPKADISSIPMRAGDYAKEQTEEVMNKPTVTGDAIEHYRELCDGVPMLVFCTSVQHAKDVAQAYVDAGYRAASVDGAMDDADRKDRIEGLGTGKWQIITSCDLIGEGLDVPVVGAVQLLRPTKSLIVHLQQIGRGLRPAADKKCLFVLDHVNNVRTLGTATQERQWSLEGTRKSRKDKLPSLKTCGQCFLVHEPSPTCPNCGYEYPKATKALTRIEVVEGKLVKIEETREERAEAMRDCRSLVELIAFAKARGYANAGWWARKVYGARNYIGAMPKL